MLLCSHSSHSPGYRSSRRATWQAALFGGWLMALAMPAIASADDVDFATTIQPLLAKRCYSCHGPDKQEGGIRLDQRATLLEAADSGEMPIVPGDSAKSELVRRIESTDDSERMPPEGEPLKKDQIAALRQWIDAGAEYAPHWAFQPVQRRLPPDVEQTAALSQPLDAFIEHKLEDKGLELSPQAPAADLIRRVYLDTIGLPPSPEALAEHLADWSAESYARLVERLLADPAFGDRWARHWLDVVRYAETNSFERDGAKPNAWKYRDYVIRAMNSDKPYDQFIKEQIAGDELDEV
ncbi:MAG: DUF1549 domain-containing protein, partial [Aureliella sp.]